MRWMTRLCVRSSFRAGIRVARGTFTHIFSPIMPDRTSLVNTFGHKQRCFHLFGGEKRGGGPPLSCPPHAIPPSRHQTLLPHRCEDHFVCINVQNSGPCAFKMVLTAVSLAMCGQRGQRLASPTNRTAPLRERCCPVWRRCGVTPR